MPIVAKFSCIVWPLFDNSLPLLDMLLCWRSHQFSFSTGDGQWLSCFAPKKIPRHLRLLSNSRIAAKAAYTADSKAIEIPRQWYNLIADLPVKPPPPLHPKTFEPVKPEDLSPLFPDELIKQEATNERFIDIPEEVIDVYRLWRPTPLIRLVLLDHNKYLSVISFA